MSTKPIREALVKLKRPVDLSGPSEGPTEHDDAYAAALEAVRAIEEMARTLTADPSSAEYGDGMSKGAVDTGVHRRGGAVNDHDSVLLALEAERHNHRKNVSDVLSQRDEARADLLKMAGELREVRVEVERLTKERDEAEARFANERDRAEALREKAEILTRERDEALEKAEGVAALTGGLADLSADFRRVLELVQHGSYAGECTTPIGEECVRAIHSLNAIPASHAEKVLVSVAKAAARLGAEDFRKRAVEAMWRDVPRIERNAAYRDFQTNMSIIIDTVAELVPPTEDES